MMSTTSSNFARSHLPQTGVVGYTVKPFWNSTSVPAPLSRLSTFAGGNWLQIVTRSPSNLKGRDCAPANACIKLCVVTSGHLTKMAVTLFDVPCPKTPWYTQTSWLPMFYRTGLHSKLYTAGIEIFDLFLLLWPWPWPDDLHIRTWLIGIQTYTKRVTHVSIWLL